MQTNYIGEAIEIAQLLSSGATAVWNLINDKQAKGEQLTLEELHGVRQHSAVAEAKWAALAPQAAAPVAEPVLAPQNETLLVDAPEPAAPDAAPPAGTHPMLADAPTEGTPPEQNV
jgi:hypothetical protein